MTATDPSPARSADEATDAGLPSQGVRTTVNFLLFVHLFSLAVLVAVQRQRDGAPAAASPGAGLYLQVLGMDVDFDSGQRFNWVLQSRDRPMVATPDLDMKARLSRLRQNLMQARSGRIHEAEKDLTALQEMQKQSTRDISRRGLYHLTHADVLDIGHFLEFRYRRAGEDEQIIGLPGFRRGMGSQDEVASLPATIGWPGFWPRQRYLRYQMLAREIGRLAGTENIQDILPAAITESILQSEGITLDELGHINARLYCRRLLIRSAEDVAMAREPIAAYHQKDPWDARWFVTAYEKVPVVIGGRIRFSDITSMQRDYTPAVSGVQ